MSFGEGSLMDQKKKLDADELAVLAGGIEGCHGELSHGDLVWAKVKGWLPTSLRFYFYDQMTWTWKYGYLLALNCCVGL